MTTPVKRKPSMIIVQQQPPVLSWEGCPLVKECQEDPCHRVFSSPSCLLVLLEAQEVPQSGCLTSHLVEDLVLIPCCQTWTRQDLKATPTWGQCRE